MMVDLVKENYMRFILIFYLMLVNLIGQENSNNDLLIIDKGPRYLGKYIGKEGEKLNFSQMAIHHTYQEK